MDRASAAGVPDSGYADLRDHMQLTPERETANRYDLISRMADDLAHEIKNPLNSMVINLEVLRARARKSDTEGVLGRADVLEAEIRRLNGLVEGLLRLLRPDRQGRTDIPIDSLLEELDEMVGLQAKLARRELNVTLAGDTLSTTGRRDRLRFALLNLVCAELDAAAGDGAGVDVTGGVVQEGIVLTIVTRGAPPGDDPHRTAAIEIADALVADSGGRVLALARPEGGTGRAISVTLSNARPA